MKKEVRSDLSRKLIKRRKKLDLINQNCDSSQSTASHQPEIGKIKREMGKKIYDAEREKEILDRLKRKNRVFEGKDLKEIFATIMKVCRQSQIQTYRPSKPKDLG